MASLESMILEQLFVKISLTYEAITSILKDPTTGEGFNYYHFRDIFNDMIAKKYVIKKQEIITMDSKRKTNERYMITYKGLCRLIDNALTREDSVKSPWVKYIDLDGVDPRLNYLGDILLSTSTLYGSSDVALIAEMAGASMPVVLHNYTDDTCKDILDEPLMRDDAVLFEKGLAKTKLERVRMKDKEKKDIDSGRKKTFRRLLINAVNAWQNDENKDRVAEPPVRIDTYPNRDDSDYIRFVHPATAKLAMMCASGKAMTEDINLFNDISRTRFVGLLQSHKRIMLMYTCPGPTMLWPSDLSYYEKTSITKWSQLIKPALQANWDQCYTGVILVTGRRHFESIYKDKGKSRGKTTLGKNFDNLYAVPMDPNGIRMLRNIMLKKDSDIITDVKTKALNKELDIRFTLNDSSGFHNEEFPLKSELNGGTVYFAVCTTLDMCQIQRLEKFSGLEQKCGVICYDWQEEYYASVLPDDYYLLTIKDEK